MVKSADRALAVLELVAQRRSATFTDVVTALTMPRSSTHELLRTMTESGWLTFDPDRRRYGLGLKAWQVGQRYDGHQALVEAAQPIMDELSKTVGETVQLARLDGTHNVYVAISESPNPMRLVSSLGMRLPAHATGIGKALFSLLDPQEVERRLEGVELVALTPRTVTRTEDLLARVDEVRARGFAIDDEEFTEGCRCVAAPLLGTEQMGFVSALSLTMPTSRTGAAWPDRHVPPLLEAVDRIRTAVGASAP